MVDHREEIISRFLNHLPMVTHTETLMSIQNHSHNKVQAMPIVTTENITDEIILVFGKRESAPTLPETSIRVDASPGPLLSQFSRASASFLETPPLPKPVIMKSVVPCPPLNLFQESPGHDHLVTTSNMLRSVATSSTISQFKTLPKPAYQIIHKNRATLLQLAEESFQQRSPRVDIRTIVKDEPLKLLAKPLVPVVRRVPVQPPPIIMVEQPPPRVVVEPPPPQLLIVQQP